MNFLFYWGCGLINTEDLYFKYHCLYNAQTELYDRSLTDMRERYDPTSAYIDCSKEARNASNYYAYSLHLWCRRNIEYKTKQPFSNLIWKECIKRYFNLSAQGWIDLYEHLVENGDMDFISDCEVIKNRISIEIS